MTIGAGFDRRPEAISIARPGSHRLLVSAPGGDRGRSATGRRRFDLSSLDAHPWQRRWHEDRAFASAFERLISAKRFTEQGSTATPTTSHGLAYRSSNTHRTSSPCRSSSGRFSRISIIETGIARGGSLVFYASMLELIGGAGRISVSTSTFVRTTVRRSSAIRWPGDRHDRGFVDLDGRRR